MSTARLVLFGVAAIALVAAGGVAAELRWWRTAEQVEQTVPGPDSAHVARVISVREPGWRGIRYLVVRVGRRAAGGKVEADSGVLWLENASRVSVRWSAPRRLVVEYPAAAGVYGKVSRVAGVRVSAIPVDSLR